MHAIQCKTLVSNMMQFANYLSSKNIQKLPKHTRQTGKLWGASMMGLSIKTTSWGWIRRDATKYLPTSSFCLITNARQVPLFSGQWIFMHDSEQALISWHLSHCSSQLFSPHKKHEFMINFQSLSYLNCCSFQGNQ